MNMKQDMNDSALAPTEMFSPRSKTKEDALSFPE